MSDVLILPQLLWPLPADPGRVTQEFGCDKRWGTSSIDYSWVTTRMPNGRLMPMPGHNGRDIGAPLGTPIQATHAGMCWCYDDPDGYGQTVEIWAPVVNAGLVVFKTISAHMSVVVAKNRQIVEPGMLIGHVGSTGNSTGPHLHYGIKFYRNGADNVGYRGWCDPRPFMPR